MQLIIPKLSLVVLIGTSGSGKSTFARKHFLLTETIASDYCRALVADDENDISVTKEAFEILHFITSKRLAAGKLTVIDATNVKPEDRKPLVQLAREFHCIPVAIVFDLPVKICIERNEQRTDRNFGDYVIKSQRSKMRRSLRGLKREGFRHVYIFETEQQADSASIIRQPLWTDRREDHGPFDIIGDVHGCGDELEELLQKLGYQVVEKKSDEFWSSPIYKHPEGRKAVFLGDVVDRGYRILDTLKIVRNMTEAGHALCVPGNHDMKFLRKLKGKNVQLTHGLADSVAEVEALPDAIRDQAINEMIAFLDSLISHYVLDDRKLVVAHAGLKQEMQGRGSAQVREFCLYGETTGEIDEFGLPVRYNWASEYRGSATLVYGHTPVPEPEWLNRTINIDTGCVFGGELTALRYPEKELVSVPARRIYCESARPLETAADKELFLSAQQQLDDVLDIDDVIGKRFINTRLRSSVAIREENAMAALEVMSRFAINPKWLIYLPPTMSPSETSQKDGFLEYPTEAFVHYRSQGIPRVICEEKHMGSRAVVVICRDDKAAVKRFGVKEESIGVIFTRTGRPFFDDKNLQQIFLERIHAAMTRSNFWDEFRTDWACLDCELMPWSAKAQQLLKTQYAAVGASATVALSESVRALTATVARTDLETDVSYEKGSSSSVLDISETLNKFKHRQTMIQDYVRAYQRYCWNVELIDDFKLAPFHLLATEGKVHVDQDHQRQMDSLAKICEADPDLLLATLYKIVDVTDPASEQVGIDWWEQLTNSGGEGMVVKPFDFISRGKRGLVQPALKCRGREYLRIIYGPEYTFEEHLSRLRSRALHTKRNLAMNEFVLGIEALERFVRYEPLRRTHECVFGILALESEPVDPRL